MLQSCRYVHGDFAYQANYCAGLRILDVSNAATGVLSEVAWFDVAPDCDKPLFAGSWYGTPTPVTQTHSES